MREIKSISTNDRGYSLLESVARYSNEGMTEALFRDIQEQVPLIWAVQVKFTDEAESRLLCIEPEKGTDRYDAKSPSEVYAIIHNEYPKKAFEWVRIRYVASTKDPKKMYMDPFIPMFMAKWNGYRNGDFIPM